MAEPAVCLDFDLAVQEFGDRFEAERDATEQKPAPPRPKRAKHTVPVPRHDEAALMRFLGIDPEDEDAAGALAGAVDPAMWDQVWGDEDGDG